MNDFDSKCFIHPIKFAGVFTLTAIWCNETSMDDHFFTTLTFITHSSCVTKKKRHISSWLFHSPLLWHLMKFFFFSFEKCLPTPFSWLNEPFCEVWCNLLWSSSTHPAGLTSKNHQDVRCWIMGKIRRHDSCKTAETHLPALQ